jgi:leader peptidase (prepilin peptidase)/N-methyltransferase
MFVSDLPDWLIRVMAFVFGATWGSFFNVAVYRWPREMSVVSPGSHCPACGAAIPGWRNVPIFAYVLQRGRAACCGAAMTPRYLFVEALTGVLGVAVAERFIVQAQSGAELGPVGLEALLWFAFVGGLVVATFVDLEWMEIPDEVSIGGTALALATATFRPGVPLADVVLGAGGAYLTVHLLLVWSWERLTREPGMGEGDAKLLMFIGAFLGWQGALFALVAGSFQGIVGWAVARLTGARIGPDLALLDAGAAQAPVVAASATAPADAAVTATVAPTDDAVAAALVPGPNHAALAADDAAHAADGVPSTDEGDLEDASAARRIPFGPFLALGALEFLFFGDRIVAWYTALVG